MNPAFKGSLLLFLLASFCVNSCASGRVQGDFYRGLRNNSNAVSYFEKALASSNVYVRQASAEKLADLMFEGRKLSAKTEERVRRESVGAWATAFDAVGKNPNKKKALSFLLNFESRTDSNEARLYVFRECEKQEGFFSETELAAIEGHFAVSRSNYTEALGAFREFREEGEWPQQIPAIFLQYPHLINDLGRAFQYTSSSEGANVFIQWEKNLTNAISDDLRYSLLFYSGRIARRLGRTEQAIPLFEEAWSLAPDGEQTDACVWYILDLTANISIDAFIQRLEQLVPYWHEDNYYDDVLEKVLRELVLKQEWEKLIRAFDLIKNRRADSTAGYAWFIARAIEEGYLNDEELRFAAETANATVTASDASSSDKMSADAFVYMCLAYNAKDSSFYYRSKSAASLGVPVLELPVKKSQAKAVKANDKPSDVMQFLLGFFSYNAARFASPYVRLYEKELAPTELRALAEAYDKAGMYLQSIRLVSLYINREGYSYERRDLELFFPHPYKDLIEKNAAEYAMRPALLYGLVRTESAFQSDIVSSAGAVGLTQLMPATAKEMAGLILRRGGPDYAAKGLDLNDPSLNIHIGAFYLNYLMGRFDDNLLAVLAYNGGMNRVRRWRAASALPMDIFLETINVAETRGYGKKVMAAASVYEELYYQKR